MGVLQQSRATAVQMAIRSTGDTESRGPNGGARRRGNASCSGSRRRGQAGGSGNGNGNGATDPERVGSGGRQEPGAVSARGECRQRRCHVNASCRTPASPFYTSPMTPILISSSHLLVGSPSGSPSGSPPGAALFPSRIASRFLYPFPPFLFSLHSPSCACCLMPCHALHSLIKSSLFSLPYHYNQF